MSLLLLGVGAVCAVTLAVALIVILLERRNEDGGAGLSTDDELREAGFVPRDESDA